MWEGGKGGGREMAGGKTAKPVAAVGSRLSALFKVLILSNTIIKMGGGGGSGKAEWDN